MGQKVHPYGFRLGIIRKERSRWFAEGTRYREQLIADIAIRKFIIDTHRNAGISEVLIERSADNTSITIQTAKPGIIIGRGGRDVDALRQRIERRVGGRVRLNVEETPDPDINAQLVAESIAGQIERRVSHRRAMQQAAERAMRMGAQGVRIAISGRLNGAEIARTEGVGPEGRVPLHTLRADIEFGTAAARTAYGPIGVKVWTYKGEILPPRKTEHKVGVEEEGVTAEDWERVAAVQRARGGAAEGAPAVEEVAPVVVATPAEEIAPVVVEAPVVEAPTDEVAAAPQEDTPNVDA
ncbi:MAG TPA: 30S ribosomal protein S3 [Armatimonadota bacterium]|jgi:small subunit ribosomal protein S3